MGNHRVATFVILAGGGGLLVGRILAVSPTDPKPWYTADGDLRLSLALDLLLLGLAGWHLSRFGTGKLVAIGLLAAGALWSTLFDFGDGEPLWSQGHAGDELIGRWLMVASASAALVGVVWSNALERPAGTKALWTYVFGGGPGGHDEELVPGLATDVGRPPPEGWWRASDGRWYPPHLHPDNASPTGSRSAGTVWRRGRWILLAVAAYVAIVVAQFFFAGGEVAPDDRGEPQDDRGPVQVEEWRITLDEPAEGVHTVHMIKTFDDLDEADVQELGGRLVWDEGEVELCNVGIRSVGEGFIQIGDIFLTSEACDGSIDLGRAFADSGLPRTACVSVRSNGVDDEYCAPLALD